MVSSSTSPHRTLPNRDGAAERLNRSLIPVVRAMLADAKLPSKFWAEAVKPHLSFATAHQSDQAE